MDHSVSCIGLFVMALSLTRGEDWLGFIQFSGHNDLCLI